MAKYKMTGFARFFIFLIVATPIVYLIASYYNGEDGVANIKSLFEKSESTESVAEETHQNTQDVPSGTSDVEVLDITAARKIIDSLQQELDECLNGGN